MCISYVHSLRLVAFRFVVNDAWSSRALHVKFFSAIWSKSRNSRANRQIPISLHVGAYTGDLISRTLPYDLCSRYTKNIPNFFFILPEKTVVINNVDYSVVYEITNGVIANVYSVTTNSSRMKRFDGEQLCEKRANT